MLERNLYIVFISEALSIVSKTRLEITEKNRSNNKNDWNNVIRLMNHSHNCVILLHKGLVIDIGIYQLI